jgi:protein-export membrane protein SecD
MFYYPRWKIISILASVLISALIALPNVLSPVPKQYVADHFGLRPLTLGLDLQGGSNILMEVDHKDLVEKLQQQLSSDVRTLLRDAKIGYSGIAKIENGVTVKVTKPEDVEKAKTELNKLLQPLNSGLFSTGVATNLYKLTQADQQFTYAFDPVGFDAKVSAAVQTSLKIMESRVNGTGTREPVIQQQGKDRIVIQLPGLQDPESLKKLLEGTGKLSFNLLCAEQPSASSSLPPPDCRAVPEKADVDRLKEALAKEKNINAGEIKLTEAQIKTLPQMWVQTSSRATVDGADLTDAQPGFGQQNDPLVSFSFNQKGAVRFGKLTQENIDKPFAIILDDIVQSAPVIRSAILGGTGQISGRFTIEETNTLSIVLRSGALPAKLNIVEERTVGPSLGADSIKAGLIASLAGLIFVMAFIMLPYGFFGLIANTALLINLLMLVAIMSLFGFTLTLPGIAGIVLTLGMAVDSNVLIYERVREEWRNGRTAMGAIETGFKAALATVVDANVTTLIAAVVLFGVGSGPIRGFAVTLGVGIVTTMFTAFTMTRFFVAMWVKRNRPKEINL